MPQVKETTWNLLVSGERLHEISVPRCKDNIEMKVPNDKVESYYAKGWNHLKTNKKNTTIYKEKSVGDAFEDEVWSVFFNMGFKIMNENNRFAIVYGEQSQISKQIDIVAIDDETCLLIECKESWKYDTKRNLQMDINEVPAYFTKCCNVLKERYNNLKFKCIFATKNISVTQHDKDRMKENGIVHFDYSTVLYYKALASHLGTAAKYQLLGQLFAGQNIHNIDANIPAIRGKMGPYTYYSFVISPEKLLKISYVLHKTNANNDYEDLLPSYQRLIKKDRLKSVRTFINDGNFFPNSIIISIDAKKPLQFDFASKEKNDDSKVEQAARTLYLNRVCYNGLYRVNSNGQFNVPLGRYVKPEIVSENKILDISNYLNANRIDITSTDFVQAVQGATAGDLVYFDPPYDYEEGGFTSYTSDGFSRDDLCRLKHICDELIKIGCKVVISNNDTSFVNSLFDDKKYTINHVLAKRMINCKGQRRNSVNEVIIYG